MIATISGRWGSIVQKDPRWSKLTIDNAMKATKYLSGLALASVLTGLATPVMAQSDRRGGSGLIGALDLNGNGKLEPGEIDLAVASLRKLDRNKDGEITREELGGPSGTGRPGGAPGQGGGQRRGMPNFSELDKDGDGKISKEEAPDRMKERFDQMDKNGDGFFDKAEQDAFIKMIRERFQQGGQRRPDQPGRPGGRSDRPDRSGGTGETDKPKRPAPKDE